MVQRLVGDFYPTDRRLTESLLKVVDLGCRQNIFEPCAGRGDMANVLADCGHYVLTADIECHPGLDVTGFDASDPGNWRMWQRYDWIVTNPPYNKEICTKIVENSWQHSKKGIAMLLRLSYLEPCKNRQDFLKQTPLSHLLVFNPRPQFRADKSGSDNSTVAWFVWQKDWQDGTQIHYITDWKNAQVIDNRIAG